MDNAAGSRVRIFVAGLGNVDRELEKFRDLATATDGVFVKASRADRLRAQFEGLGALIADGGVVVTARTSEVTVNPGGNPYATGWMRFRKPSGGCPSGTAEHDATTCKVQF